MINFALEMDEYTVNETAGIVSIGVVKQSGSIGAGQSITVVVTPMQGTGTRGDAGMYLTTLQISFHNHNYYYSYTNKLKGYSIDALRPC